MTTDGPEYESVDPALLAGLATRAGDLENGIKELIETVRLNRIARVYIVILTLALVAGTAVNLWSTHETNKNTNVIIDCTDPDGRCYKEARAAGKENVKLINEISIAAAYCAKQPENKTIDQVKTCVNKSLSHD